jgi:dihydroxy-acid dehydratase
MPGSTPWAMRRAQWAALGLTDADLEKGAAGGPLGLVRDGDMIGIDVDGRAIDLEVDPAELERRRAELPPLRAPAGCGWLSVYARTVGPLARGATLSDGVSR